MRSRQFIDRSAGLIASVRQGKQVAHLVNEETQITGSADEGQTVQLRLAIGSVVALGAGGRGQQADPLLVADRLDLGVGPPPQFADAQRHFGLSVSRLSVRRRTLDARRR